MEGSCRWFRQWASALLFAAAGGLTGWLPAAQLDLPANPPAAPPALQAVAKPAVDPAAPERRARAQPTVPKGCTELPFVETAPAPVPTGEETQCGFLLFHRPITEPVYPGTRPLAEERLQALKVFGTPGEFAPVTFSVDPLRPLKNFRVSLSALTAGDHSLPAATIDLRLVTCWNIGYPMYSSRDHYRCTPELLEAVTVQSCAAGVCQRYWLTLHLPEDAAPGLYRGTVTVWDDDSPTAVAIPLVLRVLSFHLQKDPAKHFSAYYYVRNAVAFQGRDEAFIQRATANEYQAMADHGLDRLPTFNLKSDDGKTIALQYPEELERMRKAGLQGPLPVTADGVIRRFYLDAVPGGKVAQHWDIATEPPAEFYTRLTTAFKAFEAERQAKGWPEIVCCPLDEVAAARAEFGAKVFAAVMAAGIRTYATKDPTAPDAHTYQSSLDIWCSQPYSMPYEKLIAQQRYEYWSYPNHNAGEIKDPVTMCRGGRMTYGFGLWRSGYTTLMPWHWSWTPPPDPFDYLRGARSGCGQRIGDDGTVIPAVYWECFREGIDDGRYLYTLEAAVQVRKGNAHPACQALVTEGQRLLDATWASIHVQSRYLAEDLWTAEEFDAIRWRMADLTERLGKFPVVASAPLPPTPSVLLTDTHPGAPAEGPSPAEQDLAQGRVEARDLGGDWADWKNGTREGRTEITIEAARAITPPTTPATTPPPTPTPPGLRWTVVIDQKKDGDGALGGKYPVGWPRLSRAFDPGVLDITGYDALVFWLRIDSNRDEVADDRTPVTLLLRSHKSQLTFQKTIDFGDRQRVWIPLRVPVSEVIQGGGGVAEPWTAVSEIQLFLSESNYPDGAKLVFDLGGVTLERYKVPTLGAITAARRVLLPAAVYPVDCEVLGPASYHQGSHTLQAAVLNPHGDTVATCRQDLALPHHLALDLAKASPGAGLLRLTIFDAQGQACSQAELPLELWPGPLFAP